MSTTALALDPNLVVIPAGKNVIASKGNKLFLQAKSRVKRFKTSLKVRQKISAGLRRFKLPVITTAAQLPWALPLAGAVFKQGGRALGGDESAQRLIASEALAPFVGVRFGANWAPIVKLENLWRGLIPNIMAWGIRKLGVFRGVNKKLGMSRIPISLS